MSRTLIVVGGGPAGLGVAALLRSRGLDVLLLEAHDLGGCAATFTRGSWRFNAGATTLVGLERDRPVGGLLADLGLDCTDILQVHRPSMLVQGEGWQVERGMGADALISQLSQVFPGIRHRRFWRRVRTLDARFWRAQAASGGLSYGWRRGSWRSLWRNWRLLGLAPGIWPAALLARSCGIGPQSSCRAFLDNQALVAAQAPLPNLSSVVAALALAYADAPGVLVRGGMGRFAERLAQAAGDVRARAPVELIERRGRGWRVWYRHEGHLDAEDAAGVVLAVPPETGRRLFAPESAEGRWLESRWRQQQRSAGLVGAFVVYAGIAPGVADVPSHLQYIGEDPWPGAISRSLFASVSPADGSMAPEGARSLTISTHVDPHYWMAMESAQRAEARAHLQESLLGALVSAQPALRGNLLMPFNATPSSFARFVGRSAVGGIPLRWSNFPWRMEQPVSPFAGLWLAGDSCFPGQGWPGALLGARNAAGQILQFSG